VPSQASHYHIIMLPDALLTLLVALVATTAAQQPDPSQDSVDDYAPASNVQCPDLSTTNFLRIFTPQNQTLHPEETEYINQRATKVLPDAWNAWLGGDSPAHGYNLSDFGGNYPKIAVAIPGGGLRSALYAAGTLSALDSRNDSAKAAGTGGLLQVASYLSGLSGM
jgi:lysophospholipase